MPIFALVDCNNFYASCEKLFDPTLKDRPVVVLSNNDGFMTPIFEHILSPFCSLFSNQNLRN